MIISNLSCNIDRYFSWYTCEHLKCYTTTYRLGIRICFISTLREYSDITLISRLGANMKEMGI